MQSFINNTFNEEQIEYRYVLDPDNKSELKIDIYDKNKKHLNNKCPITMELFKDGDSVTMLPCGHLFNTNAIDEWLLNSQAKCPVCRHSLKNVKEIRITPTPRDVSNNTELPIHTNNSTNDINYILSNLFRNYLMQPLNSIENVDISNNIENVDISNNIENVDISNNVENVDISNNNENIETPTDPIINNLNNYINMINRIVNRRIEEENENIMQQVILDSL